MPMSVSEREHVSLLRRHAHAAGSLAQAMADAVSPLALSKSLQVAVQSFGVCIEALRTLAATTETVELDTNKARLPPLLLLLLLLLRAASLHGSCLDFITACCATYQQGSPARASPPPCGCRFRCWLASASMWLPPTPTLHGFCPACTWLGLR